MDYYLAIYSSITLANRVKACLPHDGDIVSTIHTPKVITAGGCSYALRFRKNKLPLIKKVSQDYGVKIKGIYQETIENGSKVYYAIK